MTQKLKLKAPIGERGKPTTRFEVAAMLTYSGGTHWFLNVKISGTSSDNYSFEKSTPRRELSARGGSVRDVKRQAVEIITGQAAGFLQIKPDQLKSIDWTWVDESD